MIAVLFVQNETGYDQVHERSDRIYRVALDRIYTERVGRFAASPGLIGKAMQQEFPEIQEMTRLLPMGGAEVPVKAGDRTFEERRVYAVDSNFFRVFTGTFVQGDAITALQKPNTMVVNESTAKKYFGSAGAAMGKELELFDGDRKVVIGGVCRDWPEKSHFNFNLLIPISSFPGIAANANYYDISFYTYLLLKPGASAVALEKKFPSIIDKYVAGSIEKGFGQSYREFIRSGNGYRYYLQPIRSIHLDSDLEEELAPNGSRKAMNLFTTIAAFILFLACINFINLSTANSVERAKEVGVRKTFGSGKRALIRQFLLESVMLSFTSLLIGMLLAWLLLPIFNRVSGSALSFGPLLHPAWILALLSFAMLVGTISGLYPALVLSSFQPILVLKGRFRSHRVGMALRNGLVIFQFSISVILIICTMVVYRQMKFVLGDEVGFKKEHILAVQGAYWLGNKREVFKNELSRLPGVELMSACSDLPGAGGAGNNAIQVMDSRVSRTESIIFVDDKYAEMFGLHTKEGRFFSKDNPAGDSLSLVLNEKAVQDLQLKTPIGTRITSTELFLNGPSGPTVPYVYTVIGVVKDYHFESMRQGITPLVLFSNARAPGGTTALRIKAANLQTVIPAIEKIWRRLEPRHNLSYTFLDDILASQYKSELRTQQIFTIFSFIAIFIGCIGLFGLATHATLQRTREISIRKILGAKAGNIVLLLSGDFLRLVVIATLIAFPLAWWIMYKWLQNFAYHQSMTWWMFLLAAAAAVLIAFATIGFRAVKAAISNPTKTLRSE
jgi:putative ABC transport system permease protein